jgi:gliding-associated putative ABC transporter substrate-binding component GldG
MKNKKSITAQVLLIVAVLVVLNFLADIFFLRLDFTADQRYTLSESSKSILRSLDEPVTVTAYFTEDLPPEYAASRQDFKDLLTEYANVSRGNVVYEFLDPGNDPAMEQKAVSSGIFPMQMNMREKDEVVLKKIYMGAVLQLGEKSEPIPAIQPGAAMEYDLSTAIKKLSVTSKQSIGLLQGHGEPGKAAMPQAMQAMDVLYSVEPLILNPELDLRKYKAIAIIGPTDTIPEQHLRMLDGYLAGGGNLFIAMDRVNGDFTTVQGTPVETGLERWLAQKGLVVESNFVIDANCGSVSVRQGNFPFPVQIPFPYLPKLQTFAEHPITEGLEQVMLQFGSAITYTGDTANQYIPIAFSSDKSGTKSTPLYFEVNKRWGDVDFPLSKITLGAVLRGTLAGDLPSSIVLISDGQFPVNGEGQRGQELPADNINLLVNAIDWLSDDTGLINLRTKGVTSRPLDQVDDGKKSLLKWLNFLLPIILILIYGIIRMQRRRNLKVKRMEKGYV